MSSALPREWYGEGVRNFGVQREQGRLRVPLMVAYAAVTAVLFGCLLLYVSLGLRVIGMGYEIDALQDRYRELKTQREQLEVEHASLQSLQAVAREAVENLGMVFPGPEQVIVVREASARPGEPMAGSRAFEDRETVADARSGRAARFE